MNTPPAETGDPPRRPTLRELATHTDTTPDALRRVLPDTTRPQLQAAAFTSSI